MKPRIRHLRRRMALLKKQRRKLKRNKRQPKTNNPTTVRNLQKNVALSPILGGAITAHLPSTATAAKALPLAKTKTKILKTQIGTGVRNVGIFGMNLHAKVATTAQTEKMTGVRIANKSPGEVTQMK